VVFNDSAIAGATNTTHNVTAPGIYKVQVKVDDCVSEFSVDLPLIVTGDLAPSQSIRFNVYPNPTENYLYVDGLSSQAFGTITNYLGAQQSVRQEVKDGQLTIYTSELTTGIYLLKIQHEKQTHVFRFLKK
jgi:hypothetical protein